MKPIDLNQLSALIEPVLTGRGFELCDLEWKHEAGRWVLRVFIDRLVVGAGESTEKVGLEDCAQASRELSAVLDVSDAIAPQYTLEVSSPGLNRPLKKEAHFRRFVGQKARIRTRHPVGDNRRNFAGTLVEVSEGRVRIDVGGQTFDLPVDDVEKANLVYEF